MSQKFGLFDAEGRPLGFFADDIHTPEQIPPDAVPITDEQWQYLLSNTGSTFVDGEVVSPELSPAPREV